MATLSDTSTRLLARVTWEWQPLEPILVDLTYIVAPGKALRAFRKKAVFTRTPDDEKVKQYRRIEKVDDQIRSGARSLLTDSLHSLIQGGYIEMRGARADREVRRRERRKALCPFCPEEVDREKLRLHILDHYEKEEIIPRVINVILGDIKGRS